MSTTAVWRRLIPRPLVRAFKRVGAGAGYFIVRPETDRIADQLNDSLVESLAYLERRLSAVERALDREDALDGWAPAAAAYAGRALSTLEPGAPVLLLGEPRLRSVLEALGLGEARSDGAVSAVLAVGTAGELSGRLGEARGRVSAGTRCAACLTGGDGSPPSLPDGWRLVESRTLRYSNAMLVTAEAV